MIKSFLIPISFWIASKAKNKKPYTIGFGGGQGAGKTTISSIVTLILKKYFKLSVFKISIDDFYKTRKERFLLSKKIHPAFMTRGVPGTHDTKIIFNFFKKIRSRNFKSFKMPKFDKSIDDRCKKNFWYKIKQKPDVIILEGWCVGARAQQSYQLKKSINFFEKNNDQNLVWRKYVNFQLKTKYKKIFNKLNCLMYLKSKNKKNLKIMNKKEVIKFMQTYQRITQNMFKDAPKYCSIILNLNSNHQIKSVDYRK